MNATELLKNESPLKTLSAELRQMIVRIAEGLCASHLIEKSGRELVIHFGYITDCNNLEAISTWVYRQIEISQAESQEMLLQQIIDNFESTIYQL